MINLSTDILEKVCGIIEHYHMCRQSDVFVAYSGGKDSFFISIVLRELGYKVHPIILDIGYDSDWTYCTDILKPYGLKAEIINNDYVKKNFGEFVEKEVSRYYRQLTDNIFSGRTICTPCFNAKVILLRSFALKTGINEFVFGHHGTDAITSFMKAFLMYQDRFILNHEKYQPDQFKETIQKYKILFINLKSADEFIYSELYKRINELNMKGLISTDEPIRQNFQGFSIIRPLFCIFESEIKSVTNKVGIQFPKAECFRENLRSERILTPREMIQEEFSNNSGISNDIKECILKFIQMNFDSDGMLKFDSRRNRTNILGAKYEKNLQICKKL